MLPAKMRHQPSYKCGDQASGKCCIHEARSSQMHEKSVSREHTSHDSAQSSAQRTSDPTFLSENAAKSLGSLRRFHASFDI